MNVLCKDINEIPVGERDSLKMICINAMGLLPEKHDISVETKDLSIEFLGYD